MTIVGTDEESVTYYHANMTVPFIYSGQDPVDKFIQLLKARFYNTKLRKKCFIEHIRNEEYL